MNTQCDGMRLCHQVQGLLGHFLSLGSGSSLTRHLALALGCLHYTKELARQSLTAKLIAKSLSHHYGEAFFISVVDLFFLIDS